jgi:murein DD-endopeptidase MepM/ murein hydrolase activator NlpD
MRWARDFAENLLPAMLGADWVWIMPEDLGLRDDNSGGGAFSAPRVNNPGGHSGIDILASVGTPLFAPCGGPVLVGYDAGYGNYVQLSCEIPAVFAGDDSLWASILFAHLDSLAVDSNDAVTAGQMVGAVGKTGNAGGQGINPHVHFEIALHASLAAAQAESHASADHSGNAAGDLFAARFESECLSELDFMSTSGPSMKGRRADPFMLLTCLSSDKPTLMSPPPALQAAWTMWSDHYNSSVFDVDVGL